MTPTIAPEDELVERLRTRAKVYAERREISMEALLTRAADAITGLQDRIERLEGALRRLSFAAQTSGGTAGRDEELVAAIGEARAALIGDGEVQPSETI